MDKDMLKAVIESLLFASDRAVTVDTLSNAMDGPDNDKPSIRAALKELIEEYKARNSGLRIEEVAGGFQFRTNPDTAPWLRRFFKAGVQKMSRAAMEALSVVAYKQPVTRGELESVRGVDSGAVLATLMDKRLIKITGRKETPGRPVVYGTTKEFLETFDLKDLSCLPSLKDIRRPEEEDGERTGEGSGHGEASEAPIEGRDSVEAQGRGDDSSGQGDGEQPDDNSPRDKG